MLYYQVWEVTTGVLVHARIINSFNIILNNKIIHFTLKLVFCLHILVLKFEFTLGSHSGATPSPHLLNDSRKLVQHCGTYFSGYQLFPY